MAGYNDLPNWPEVAPDSSVRIVKEVEYSRDNVGSLLVNQTGTTKKKKTAFYSDKEDSDSSTGSFSSSSSDSKGSSVVSADKVQLGLKGLCY